MTLFVSEDSQFEAAALQRAVDADREEEATPGAPPRLGVRVVLVVLVLSVLCALAGVGLWGTWR
jgi:hypothetical protein